MHASFYTTKAYNDGKDTYKKGIFGRLEYNKVSALQQVDFWDLVESERSLSEEET